MEWIHNLADSAARLAHWRLCLSKFDFEVEHRADVKHQNTDVLSQLIINGKDNSSIEDDILLLAIETSNHVDTLSNADDAAFYQLFRPLPRAELLCALKARCVLPQGM